MEGLTKRAKPILKWAGGKSSLLSVIWSMAPEHFSRYLEPFLGGAAVFLSLPRRVPSVLTDANPELIHLYRMVRSEPERLMEQLEEWRGLYSEPFYYWLRDQEFDSDILRAARTIFLNKTGFNGLYRQNSRGKFNVPFGKRALCPALYDRRNVLHAADRLRASDVKLQDFEATLGEAGAGDLVYCDPPYAPLSKTACFKSYTGQGFTDADQRRLRDACSRAADRGATVILSNSSAPSILALYSGYSVTRIPVRRAINSRGDRRGPVDEICVVLDGALSVEKNAA